MKIESKRCGALEFAVPPTGKKSGSVHICRYAGHPKTSTFSAPFRVFVAGHPYLDDAGEQLYVCRNCMAAMAASWNGLCGLRQDRAA